MPLVSLPQLEIELKRYPEISTALETAEPVLVEDVSTSPLYAEARKEWALSRSDVKVRSVIALPFRIDGIEAGVVFLRTLEGEPISLVAVERTAYRRLDGKVERH